MKPSFLSKRIDSIWSNLVLFASYIGFAIAEDIYWWIVLVLVLVGYKLAAISERQYESFN